MPDMKAVRKRFQMKDYLLPGKESSEATFREENADPDAYHNAIANFLTKLGPSRVIGIQTPGIWYRISDPITDVWYWKE